MDENVHTLTVESSGTRLDVYVAGAFPDASRSGVQRWIAAGQVTVNGEPTRVSYKVRSGDTIRVTILAPVPVALLPEPIPLSILYEDADIIVVDKPAGLVVHPGAGNSTGTLVNAILAHCPDLQGIGGEIRPGIVHRLDKDTSGVLVIAKHDHAIRALQAQFKQRSVRKRYLALAIGDLTPDSGIIEAPIGRHPAHRQKMAVTPHGRAARTRWRVLMRYRDGRGRSYTLVEVGLHTGRTHQIRVHMAWLGYPLVGDAVYGPAHPPLEAPRQFLHARDLSFVHPTSGQDLMFRAPLPQDLRDVLALLTPIEPEAPVDSGTWG